MKISVFVYGTRGDVQPMLALATGLRKNGHEIVFIANPENEEIVKSYDFQFVPFGPNVKEQIKENALLKRSPMRASSSAMKEFKKYVEDQLTLLPDIINGSDLVLNAGLGMGVATAADIMNIPYRFVIFYPLLLGSGNSGTIFDHMKEKLGVLMANALLKGLINKNRTKAGIQPIEYVVKSYEGKHVIVAADVALSPVPVGVSANYTQTGYMFLAPKNELPENVDEFIESGTTPVFIGFGSNPVYYPQELTQMFNIVSKVTQQRLIVSKGWSDLDNINSSSDVLYVDEMPYELLFPKMSAVIHHGGTGTMAYAARAGIPQAAFPYMADQFYNRKQIARLGIGPITCDFKKMTSNTISKALLDCITNESYKKNAFEISQKIKNADGLKLTLELLEEEFNNSH